MQRLLTPDMSGIDRFSEMERTIEENKAAGKSNPEIVTILFERFGGNIEVLEELVEDF